MKLLVSYAINPPNSGIRIEDVTMSIDRYPDILDESAIDIIRKALSERERGLNYPAILSITKLDTP